MRQWVRTAERDSQRIVELQEEIERLREHVMYAVMEAREERATLSDMGVSTAAMDFVAKVPEIPKMSAESLFRTADMMTMGVASDDDSSRDGQQRDDGND